MMNKLKYFFILILVSVIISCGGDDEKKNENANDNTEQLNEQEQQQKETPKEHSSDTVKENKVSKTDTSTSKELKFYSKTEKPEAVISAVEAEQYVGKVVTVKGLVADVYKTERVAYLNFVEKFPKNPFSGVVFAGKFDTFGDLNIYEGKNVQLTGRVSVYKGKPQIIMDSKEQIKILE